MWVRVSFKAALKSLRIEEIVMNNAGVLPYLSPGKNKVSVTVADPKALGENRLVVTYAYAPGYRDKSFEDLYKEHKRLFASRYATLGHGRADRGAERFIPPRTCR